jgi:hypothetical protein
VENIVLVPIDEDEACAWVDILCDPLCGASLLMALIPGAIQSSYDQTKATQVDEMFITVPPESLKPKRRQSLTTSAPPRRKSTRRGSATSLGSAVGAKPTAVLMEQSDAIIEEARAMMRSLSQEEIPSSPQEPGGGSASTPELTSPEDAREPQPESATSGGGGDEELKL